MSERGRAIKKKKKKKKKKEKKRAKKNERRKKIRLVSSAEKDNSLCQKGETQGRERRACAGPNREDVRNGNRLGIRKKPRGSGNDRKTGIWKKRDGIREYGVKSVVRKVKGKRREKGKKGGH